MLIEYISFAAFALVWLTWRSLTRQFAAIHFHNPPDFLVFAGLPARLTGTRLILDIHDLSSHVFAIRNQGRWGRLIGHLLVAVERLAAVFVDRVLTVHEPYRQELIAHGIPAPKLVVVMNSVDPTVIERAQDAPPAVTLDGSFTIAYHGTLTWWYGADLLVEAVDALRAVDLDIRAVILGDGDVLPSLRAAVAERGLSQQIWFSGAYLPIERALATVRHAACGVIPNRPSEINQFALSSKLFEYIALGLPVVVARLPTLEAHFSPDEVTFFEPGDGSALAAAVRWVHDHPAEARAKTERARLRASAYSWDRVRAELVSAYTGLRLFDP